MRTLVCSVLAQHERSVPESTAKVASGLGPTEKLVEQVEVHRPNTFSLKYAPREMAPLQQIATIGRDGQVGMTHLLLVHCHTISGPRESRLDHPRVCAHLRLWVDFDPFSVDGEQTVIA